MLHLLTDKGLNTMKTYTAHFQKNSRTRDLHVEAASLNAARALAQELFSGLWSERGWKLVRLTRD